MDKKSVGEVKRQFKVDNKNAKFNKLASAYVYSTNEIACSLIRQVEPLDETEQSLFFETFKKILGGKAGSNSHLLKFKAPETQDAPNPQQQFLTTLYTEYSDEHIQTIIKDIASKCEFEDDYVINIIFGNYQKPPKRTKGQPPTTFKLYRFMACSINPVFPPQKAVYFNAKAKDIGTTSSILKEIALRKPIEGFLFPGYEDNTEDVNMALYYTQKFDDTTFPIITEVLGCEEPDPNMDWRNEFKNLLSEFIEEAEGVNVVDGVYKELATILDTDGPASKIGAEQLTTILKTNGVDVTQDEVCMTYEKIIGHKELTVEDIAPKGEVEIVSRNLNVKIPQEALEFISFITDAEGNRSLVVALDESEDGIFLDDIQVNPIHT